MLPYMDVSPSLRSCILVSVIFPMTYILNIFKVRSVSKMLHNNMRKLNYDKANKYVVVHIYREEKYFYPCEIVKKIYAQTNIILLFCV